MSFLLFVLLSFFHFSVSLELDFAFLLFLSIFVQKYMEFYFSLCLLTCITFHVLFNLLLKLFEVTSCVKLIVLWFGTSCGKCPTKNNGMRFCENIVCGFISN